VTGREPHARVAVVGSVNVDLAVRAERFVRPGETMRGDSFAMSLGGKGANQAVAAARLGADVLFIARTGRDSFGDFARTALARAGLDLAHVVAHRGAGTGIAIIALDSAGQNAITIVPGENDSVSAEDCDASAGLLARSRVLLLQCETPQSASIAAARIVRSSGGMVILDPAPAPKDGISPELIELCDVVTPNESEAASLTGLAVTDAASGLAAARALVAQGFISAVVKLGGAGLVWVSGEKHGFLPAVPVKVVDTVAAGDCFNAGLAVALGEGRTLEESLHIALACGALAVTRAGAADAAPTRPEVADLLARHGISG
jgi:ribokinase